MNKQQDSCPCVPQNASRLVRRPGRPIGDPDPEELSSGICELIRHLNQLIRHSPHGNRSKMIEYAADQGIQNFPSKDQLGRWLGKDAHRGHPPGPDWEACQRIGTLCSSPGRRDLILAHLAELWHNAHGHWPAGWEPLVEELVDDLRPAPSLRPLTTPELQAEQALQSPQPVDPVTHGLPHEDDPHLTFQNTVVWQPSNDPPPARNDPRLPDQRPPS